MKTGKQYLWTGLALLLAGALAVTMGQMIIESLLGIEREFGEEPLSIKVARFGLLAFVLGLGLMLYGGWKNKKG